jgi:hypothetical protein
MMRLQFADPEEFGRQLGAKPDGIGTIAGDLALVTGDLDGAARIYADLVRCDSGQLDAWSGLVLALSGQSHAAQVLLQQPELLPAVYREVRADPTAPNSLAIARWLCGTGLLLEPPR